MPIHPASSRDRRERATILSRIVTEFGSGPLPPVAARLRGSARKGSGILEVALVLPVLMITLLAIADLGRYVYATNLMPYLAREGARWASLEANRPKKALNPQTVSNYVRSLAAGLPEDSVRVETNLEPQLVAVRVSLNFQPVLNVFGGPITVQGHASMRRQVP